MYRPLSIAICLSLCACGGSSDIRVTGNNAESNADVEQEYKTLSVSQINPESLRYASAAELERYLKNGLRLNISFGDTYSVDNSFSAGDSVSTQETSAARDTSDFSQTNTREVGVDESDHVKYDGEYLYVTTQAYRASDSTRVNSSIRILQSDPANAGITEVSQIELDDPNFSSLSELYLLQDSEGESTRVAAVRTVAYPFETIPSSTDSQYNAASRLWDLRQEVQISSFDIETPELPEQSFSFSVDGTLQTSRKIGNMLYLVTNYSPYHTGINYRISADDSAEENEQNIVNMDVDELLPHYRINGGEKQALFSTDNCLVANNLNENEGYLNLSTIIAIDLANEELVATQCVNTNTHGIYVSQDNIYVGGSDSNFNIGMEILAFNEEEFTVLHKFSLSDGLRYVSTGTIPGQLGWQDPSLRISEHNDHLRVVTTSFDTEWNPVHRLSILRDNSDVDQRGMELVAQLPNDDKPEPIGKPGEEIFAVRFYGDRAFIVTFERIDPLYVIDLSNEEAPSIAGELEVPGFSTYLHPIGENYLLGLGRLFSDADNTNQIKLSLYDISDDTNPTLVNDIFIGDGNSWTNVYYDLRAMSFLQHSNDQLRLTFPVIDYNYDERHRNSLYLFEINGLASNNASLVETGQMIAEQSNDPRSYGYSGRSRSTLHNDAVYFSLGNGEVWSAFWSSPDAVTGPH